MGMRRRRTKSQVESCLDRIEEEREILLESEGLPAHLQDRIEDYYSLGETAYALGCSVRTIQRQVRNGKLDVVQIFGRPFIQRDQLLSSV